MENKIEYTIKLATLDHLELLWSFFEKSIKSQFDEYTSDTTRFFTEKEYTKNFIKESLSDGKRNIFIAIEDKKIIGYLIGIPSYGGVSLAEWLAVEDQYQSKGIGTALLKAFEKKTLEEGGHKIHLWSAEKNIKYYEKKGFTLVGKVPENYFGADDYLLYKVLRKADEKNYLKDFLKK